MEIIIWNEKFNVLLTKAYISIKKIVKFIEKRIQIYKFPLLVNCFQINEKKSKCKLRN